MFRKAGFASIAPLCHCRGGQLRLIIDNMASVSLRKLEHDIAGKTVSNDHQLPGKTSRPSTFPMKFRSCHSPEQGKRLLLDRSL